MIRFYNQSISKHLASTFLLRVRHGDVYWLLNMESFNKRVELILTKCENDVYRALPLNPSLVESSVE